MKKKVLSGLLAIAMLFGSAAALPEGVFETSSTIRASAVSSATSGTCGENLTWTLNDGVLTISGTGAMTDYGSSNSPFLDRTDIQSVYIKSGVTSIGNLAFCSCTKLVNITIPDSVTRIGYNAFERCEDLTSVTLPNSIDSIYLKTFMCCYSLESVTLPDSITGIYTGAFYGCKKLKNINIPSSVTSIGGGAFSGCTSLTSLTIPSSVESIGSDAIDKECTIICEKGSKAEKYAKDNGLDYNYSDGDYLYKELADGTVEITKYNGNYTRFTITSTLGGKQVTSIGSDAFSNRAYLEKIIIPSSVTNIAEKAFASTPRLKKITIPDSVTTIGKNAFEKSTTIICKQGSEAQFYAAYNGNPIEYISGDYIYKDIDDETVEITGYTGKDMTLTITSELAGKTVTSIGDYAFSRSDLTSVTIPSSVRRFGEFAFGACYKLESAVIPTGVETITYDLFAECRGLKSVTIPSSVKSIEDGAFSNCSGLTSITIPGNVKYIGASAFEGCTGLKSLTIPSSVETIDDYAFGACGFTSLTVPKTVTKIGKMAIGYVHNEQYSLVKDDNFTVKCYKGTAAEKYAKDNEFKIEYIGVTHVAAKAATCTTDGNIEYWKHDGKFYSDANLTTEITQANTIVKAGHNWSKWTTTKAATCTADGSKTKTCSVCKKTETATITKLGHDYKATVVKPTCTAKGYTLHKCSRCGDNYKDTYKDATGHSWSKWTTTKKATCTTDGSKTRTCSVCKKTETATIAKLGHDYKATVVKPTCTAKGYTLHKCSRCGDSYKDTYKDATGHSWSKWTTTKAATCTADGVQTRKCTVCGKTESKTIAKTGHKFSTWKTTGFDFAKKTSTQTRKCSSCGNTETQTTKNAVSRFAGANRYDTAAMLSKASHKTTSDTVIIADAMTFQDALIAVPLAKAYNAPLLLANPNIVTKQTEAELARLKAKKIIIVNTNNALKSGTINALKNKYTTQIIRGSNCFETSKRVAEELQKKTKKAPTDVFFTTNKAFADALSISPVAALKGAPILYVDPSKKTLDSNILAYLKKVKGSIKNVYIVGGKVAVPAAIENSIKKALPKKNVKRFDGAQRYETCVMINKYFAKDLSSKTVCIAKGLDFPDALAGGVYAAATRQALFLADGKKLQDVQNTYLKSKNAGKITVFGGTVAVPDSLVKLIAKASV